MCVVASVFGNKDSMSTHRVYEFAPVTGHLENFRGFPFRAKVSHYSLFRRYRKYVQGEKLVFYVSHFV